MGRSPSLVCAQLTEAVYAAWTTVVAHAILVRYRDSCLSTEDRHHQSAATVKVVVERATVAVETARVVKMQMRTDPRQTSVAAVLAVRAQLTEAVYAAWTTVVAHAILRAGQLSEHRGPPPIGGDGEGGGGEGDGGGGDGDDDAPSSSP